MSTWPYGNHQNMVDACQIPEEVLEQLSTSDLVQTVMFYPLLDDIYAFDSIDGGFEIVKDHFRGLAELCARTDRVECLYNWLRDNREWFASTPTTSGNLYIDYLEKSQRTRFFLLANREAFFTEEINSTEAVIDAVNAILSESNCESYGGNIGPSTERKHSAIVTGKTYHPVQTNTVTDFTMKSKWGMYGLYTHNLANCPYYYYDSTNYVSDRLYYN